MTTIFLHISHGIPGKTQNNPLRKTNFINISFRFFLKSTIYDIVGLEKYIKPLKYSENR